MSIPTVLLVDDDPNLLAALRRSFAGAPLRVLAASSGLEALDVLRAEEVDVLVTDEAMPGMSGGELLTQARRLHPDVVRMMLTGHASVESTIQAINSGEVYRLFVKPTAPVELLQAILAAASARNLGRENDRLRRELARARNALELLEQVHPGISQVERDEHGAVVIDGGDAD
jgi:DNA-binding NtrC family response regulator